MKNKIFVVFLISLLIPVFNTLAFPLLHSSLGGMGPGSQYNPINVQVTQDPITTQRTANALLESNLKATYGLTNYYSCYSSNSSSYTDQSNPTVVARFLNSIQFCLEGKSMTQNTPVPLDHPKTNIQAIAPATTNTNKLNECQMTEALIDSGVIKSDKIVAARAVASADTIGGCPPVITPVAPVKTNDQICQDSYGVNSDWDGTKNDAGELVCDCKTGYQWNQGQTVCTTVPETESKIVTDDNSAIQGTVSTVDTVHDKDSLSTTTAPVKPKGFWARVFGWFGI